MVAAVNQDFMPFGIFDFTQGLNDQREPWLSPNNAWEVLENGYVFRGRVSKRQGRKKFGVLGTPVTAEVLDTSPYANPLTLALTNFPVFPAELSPSTYEVRVYEDGGGAQEVFDWPISSSQGLLSKEVTGTSFPASPSTTSRALTFNGIVLGVYADTVPIQSLPNLTSSFSAGLGSTPTSYAFVTTDPKREFRNQTSLTVSWTLPAPASVEIQLHSNWDDDVHSVNEFGVLTTQLTHADLDSAAANRMVIDPGTNATLTMNWLADPGTVTIDHMPYNGFITYATGAGQAIWATTPTADVKTTYEYNAGNPCMGIRGFFTNDGSEYLIAADTEEVWQWNNTLLRFEQQTTGGTFTGGDADFHWFEVFEDHALLTNGIDQPQKYDPALGTSTDYGTTYNPDTSAKIEAAKIALRDKNRVVWLNTIEGGGTEAKQRGRWTPVNSVEYTGATAESEDDFIDAPTEAEIVTAIKIGDDIVVGMSRGTWWRFRYDGDPESPYLWERLLGEEGASARMASVSLPEQIIARGEKALVGVDGVSVRPVDMAVPDLTRGWNFNQRKYSYAHYSKENRVILMTYADQGESLPTHVHAMHIDETRTQMSHSTYKFPFADDATNGLHCFGEYRSSTTLTHDTVFAPHNQLAYSYNDAVGVAGFPLILAGDRNSTIWNFAGGFYDDDNADVTFKAQSKRLNPFITPQGSMERCHLGWIDIQAGAVYGGTATIRLIADYDTGPYFEKTISLQPDDSSDKVYRRLLVNKIATYHAIEIEVTSKDRFDLDGIWLNAKPAGRLQAVA